MWKPVELIERDESLAIVSNIRVGTWMKAVRVTRGGEGAGYRRIATRYEQLAKHFQAMIHTAMILQFITF